MVYIPKIQNMSCLVYTALIRHFKLEKANNYEIPACLSSVMKISLDFKLMHFNFLVNS